MEERKELYQIKMKLIAGIINYEQAKKLAKPFIDLLNLKGKAIAKKHGKRFVETTFSQQMR